MANLLTTSDPTACPGPEELAALCGALAEVVSLVVVLEQIVEAGVVRVRHLTGAAEEGQVPEEVASGSLPAGHVGLLVRAERRVVDLHPWVARTGERLLVFREWTRSGEPTYLECSSRTTTTPPLETRQALAELAGPPLRTVPAPERAFGDFRVVESISGPPPVERFKVWNDRLQKGALLKALQPEAPWTRSEVVAIQQGVLRLRRAHHSALTTIYSSAVTAEGAWLAIELLAGPSVADWVLGRVDPPRRSGLERLTPGPGPARFARWVIQACRAVEAQHALGITHRSLAPSALVFDARGRIRVLPPSLPRLVSEALRQPQPPPREWRYQPPEVAAGGKRVLPQAIDVYSLGAILLGLLGEAEPFRHESDEAEVARRLRGGEVPSIPPGTPFVQTLRRALAATPERRHPSAGALADELERVVPK